jgi:hypothetical protein
MSASLARRTLPSHLLGACLPLVLTGLAYQAGWLPAVIRPEKTLSSHDSSSRASAERMVDPSLRSG